MYSSAEGLHIWYLIFYRDKSVSSIVVVVKIYYIETVMGLL